MIDPICKMTVEPENAAGNFEYQGEIYYFCSLHCLKKFQSESEPLEQKSAYKSSSYTCPMHPQIHTNSPAACPLCGMALEAELPDFSNKGVDQEFIDMRKRFIIALPLAIMVMFFSMFLMNLLGSALQMLFTSIIVFWCGRTFLERAWLSLVNKSMNMFTLIVLGTGASYFYSCFSFVSNLYFHKPDHNLYFESAALITTLVLLGQILELSARKQTDKAIQTLISLSPKTARFINKNGQETDIDIQSVKKDDYLRVRANEKIPVDGIVIEGESSVDESLMTGESQLVFKQKNDHVIAGTMNGSGTFILCAESIGSDTMLARIINLTAQAQHSRAPVQRLADTISAYFVPLVLITSILTFVIWIMFVPATMHAYALSNAISVLVIACPCALGLATPMSIKIAVGRGAQCGVLVKDAASLEILDKVDILALDKTGTLTAGKPKFLSLTCAEGFEKEEIMQIVCALEKASNHPLATAFVCNMFNSDQYKVESFKAIAGHGIAGKINGKEILLGNENLLSDNGIMPGKLGKKARKAYEEGHIVVFIAIDGKVVGFAELTDSINPQVEETITQLKNNRIQVIMLTGDHKTAAARVAKQIGVDQFESNLSPEQKAEIIISLKEKGHVVAMAGDGVNDAIALASADVGIAMGTGSDVAIEGAGITLAHGEIKGILRSIELSHLTMTNIRQNLFLAFVYNTIGIMIAAGILYPLCDTLLNPVFASAAMVLSSLSVIFNSLRLSKAEL